MQGLVLKKQLRFDRYEEQTLPEVQPKVETGMQHTPALKRPAACPQTGDGKGDKRKPTKEERLPDTWSVEIRTRTAARRMLASFAVNRCLR